MDNVFKIKDDRFSVENLDQYDLIIEFNIQRFQFIVRIHSTEVVLWLEDYFLGTEISEENSISLIKSILSNHEFLQANFWKTVTVNYNTPYYCFVPLNFNDSVSYRKYFNAIYPELNISNHTPLVEQIVLDKGILVYLVADNVIDFFQNLYTDCVIRNSDLKIINYYLNHGNGQSSSFLIFNDSFITLICYNQNKLTLEKIPLASKNLENFLKLYIKSVYPKLTIYGEITPYSVFYRTLNSISNNVNLGKIPNNVKLTQYFDDLAEHRYLSLFIS